MHRTGRHANSGQPAIDWAGLPIFSVVGSPAQHSAFLQGLRAQLEKRGFDPAILPAEEQRSPYTLSFLARLHDLVIVDGQSRLPLQRIRLGMPVKGAEGELSCPGPEFQVVADLAGDLAARLDELVNRTPVWACVLIGGKSSRMGRPKHLIAGGDGRTWLERTIGLLGPMVDGIVVSGKGDLPEPMAEITRLADIPGVTGPLAGILSAFRWQPQVSWLVVACDMPGITADAVQWLLAGRRAGCWGRVPRLAGSTHAEPLLAWYDCRAMQLFEEQYYAANLRIGEVARHPRIETPVVPEALRHACTNVNTPDELAACPAIS